MNKADPPANAFVPSMASTAARTGAEDVIEALRQRGGVFVDAVRATRMAMVLTDPTLPGNPIVFANQAFLDLSGYDMDEVLGQQPYFMNGRRTDAKDADSFRTALEEDRDVVVETLQYRKDDTRFTATVLLSAFKDDDGKTLNHFLSWTDVSRRVEAEEEVVEQREMHGALRESEEKYRSLFETMGQGYCELELVRDASGRAVDQLYLQFNPAFERLFGIPVHKARGRKASEVFPGLEPIWTETFDSAVKSGKPVRIEHSIAALGRWFEVCAYPGRGDRLVALFEEVTERKCAEIALRASEERLRDVLNTMHEGFAILGPDFTVIDVNEETLRLDGRTRAELVGRSHWEAFPGTEHSPLGAIYKQVARDRAPASLEHRYLWPDGRDMWVDVRAYPTPQGGVAVFWRDITERKAAADALCESEERYRSLFASMDEAYAVVEVLKDDAGKWADFRFLDANPAFVEHTSMPYPVGKTATELLGSPNPRWAQLYGQALDTGTPLRVEESEGSLGRTFDLNIFSLDREHHRVAVLFTNVTERKKAEQALRDSETHAHLLLAELQHRVRNILSVVRSVFTRTVESGDGIDELADHFGGRLDALARTQIVVTQNPQGTADLENLVRDELLSVSVGVGVGVGVGVTLAGPEVELTAQAAEALGLAVHELTTNSIKYGALRFPGATLAIRWSVNVDYGDRPSLVFSWEEQGVPAMPVEPGREGFGTELITRALPYRLGAKTSFELRPGGVCCLIELPLPGAAQSRGVH